MFVKFGISSTITDNWSCRVSLNLRLV